MVNSFLPSNWTDALTVAATAAEILLGIGLILGIYPRLVSLASARLLSLFAFSMTLSFGIKAPLNFSVLADAAASLLSGLKAQCTRENRPAMNVMHFNDALGCTRADRRRSSGA
jgi:uncharacterized membrane protein YphA (DoxX/SURF4 family)